MQQIDRANVVVINLVVVLCPMHTHESGVHLHGIAPTGGEEHALLLGELRQHISRHRVDHSSLHDSLLEDGRGCLLIILIRTREA